MRLHRLSRINLFCRGDGKKKITVCHLGHAEERERASLQTRKGQKKTRQDVGEGMEAKAYEYYNGQEFHFIYHRHFTERSGLDKFSDIRVA